MHLCFLHTCNGAFKHFCDTWDRCVFVQRKKLLKCMWNTLCFKSNPGCVIMHMTRHIVRHVLLSEYQPQIACPPAVLKAANWCVLRWTSLWDRLRKNAYFVGDTLGKQISCDVRHLVGCSSLSYLNKELISPQGAYFSTMLHVTRTFLFLSLRSPGAQMRVWYDW